MSTSTTGMERALACAALPLQPTGGEPVEYAPLAGDHYQFDVGTRFGEWTVTGPSRMIRFWSPAGNSYRKARTPCQCSCGEERLVKSRDLVASHRPSRSCGCQLTGFHQDIKSSAWLRRRGE